MKFLSAMVFKYLRPLFFIFLFCAACSVFAQTIPAKPNPARFVNDFAGILDANTSASLERKLRAYMDSTSTQIVVVTVASLEGYAAQEVALKILIDWGVGQKEKDNGIVFLVAQADRKVRIETGYGMEGAIPDGLAGTIIRETVLPAFRTGNFGEGISKGADAIIAAASGEYVNDTKAEEGSIWPILIIFLFFLLFFLYVSYRMRQFGGSRGTLIGRRGYTDWNHGPRPPTIFWGGGPFWGSGGGGGGGFGGDSGGGGGGFDFGGGGGGGGGAEGSW